MPRITISREPPHATDNYETGIALVCVGSPNVSLALHPGFQIQGASANNIVFYLDPYGSNDPRKNGESADGFACEEGSGEGNILRGARLWNNVDDGLDLWYAFPILPRPSVTNSRAKGVQICSDHRRHFHMGGWG
ncbi:hypothetical protein OCU04_004858 [Sclerotinia nivalis]|uniref:Uncharacterized protein n=1 Tax=Sclerotinia nivalis TaxID=352851 RepID=A0A9X0DME9_9HELO|nr:hypothetical protein OCU04_004858 [Sclerotinia nivalis]